MKIKQKLLSGFFAVSLLSLGVSYGIGLTLQKDTLQSLQDVGGEMLPDSLALSRMTTELFRTLTFASKYGETKDFADKQKVADALATLSTFKALHVLYHPEDSAWLDRVDKSTQRFSSYIAEYILLVDKQDDEKLIPAKQRIYTVLDDFVSTVTPHIENEFTSSRQALETTMKRTKNTRKTFAASVVLLMLITLIISLYISHLLSKPILQLRAAALDFGQGKLDVNLRQQSKDEIGDLTNAFNNMVSDLSKITEELIETNHDLEKQINERIVSEKALKKSEQNYREVFNGTNEAIFIHDSLNGAILDVNRTMENMYGYSHEEVFNLTIADLSRNEPPYTPEEALGFIKKAVAEGSQVFEWQARRKSGDIFWVEVALRSTEIGGKGRVLAAVRDISNRKKIERELFQSQKMEAIGNLAGGIAHDFNNILTAILGFSELAKKKTIDRPDLGELIEEIHNAGLRARDLVRQILTFSHKTEEEKINFRIYRIIEDTLKMLHSAIPATIEIKQDIQSKATILADPTQIHQVIMNLCTNAYHSMRETGGVLAVSLHEVELTKNDYPVAELEPGKYLKLVVSDNGKGIGDKNIKKIFEPYFTTKKAGEGTGLGLAVVHGIVKGHKGHISVYSEPQGGATFHVYFPITELAGENSLILAEEEQIVGGTEKIIIVDDENIIVKLVKSGLEEHGYTVTSYTNGLQALEDFSRKPGDFDLVITDMTMPYMTGAELSQKLFEIRPYIPIILCSGYSELINKEKAKAMGFVKYIEKPIILDSLLKTVRDVLDHVAPVSPSNHTGGKH